MWLPCVSVLQCRHNKREQLKTTMTVPIANMARLSFDKENVRPIYVRYAPHMFKRQKRIILISQPPVGFPRKGGDSVCVWVRWGGGLALKLQFPPTWIHNYYFSLPRAFLIPATSVSGPAGCGVGFIFIWWLTCVWTAFCSSIGADSRKGRQDNDVRRIATPSYYRLITVLAPCRCFQEPVSEGDSGWSNVLSVHIVNFTKLFTKHRGDSPVVYIIATGDFWVIFFWIWSRFSSIRMRGSLRHFCFCNVDLSLWGATGDSDYCKQTNSQ